MPTLTTISFAKDRRRYDVEIRFDDGAIMEDLLVFEVEARVTDEDERSFSQTLIVELDFEARRGRILHEGEEWYSFSLSDIPVRINPEGEETPQGIVDDTSEGASADGVADFVEEGIGGQVARLIEGVPVPDPVLGCALKAGVSSVIGQALACNEIAGSDGGTRERLGRIVGCIRQHVGSIFSRMLWRAARCTATLGVM